MSNTTIALRSSGVASNTPSLGVITEGELSLNYADGILYYKTSSNTLGSIRTTQPAGLTTEVQFNDAGSFGSNASLTYDKTTGTLNTKYLTVTNSSGDEGGELHLAVATTNNNLTGSYVVTDIYQNKLRICEGGGNNRGVSLDLSKAPNAVAGELLWKASGFVNAGTDVTCGNLKARIPTSGNRSLQISTVSGSYSVYGSDVYSLSGGIGGTTIDGSAPRSVTTTPTYINASYTFATAGATDCWTLMDTSAQIAWRITTIIGDSYNNNFIMIERLY